VPASIQEDVRDRVTHLAWRAKDVAVVAVREHGSAPSEDPVHGSRKARTEGLHSRRQMLVVGCLDDHVNVVRLDRVVHEPEAPTVTCLAEAALEFPDQTHRPQRRQPGSNLQSDMAGEARRQRRTHPVRITRVQSALAASARAPSSPARCLTEIQIELTTPPCHRGQGDSPM
jgi:hypothetical protein